MTLLGVCVVRYLCKTYVHSTVNCEPGEVWIITMYHSTGMVIKVGVYRGTHFPPSFSVNENWSQK